MSWNVYLFNGFSCGRDELRLSEGRAGGAQNFLVYTLYTLCTVHIMYISMARGKVHEVLYIPVYNYMAKHALHVWPSNPTTSTGINNETGGLKTRWEIHSYSLQVNFSELESLHIDSMDS